METERIKELEEEIQVLTAQVNAYSRECEKQKGFVEKHKTEVWYTALPVIHFKSLLGPSTK